MQDFNEMDKQEQPSNKRILRSVKFHLTLAIIGFVVWIISFMVFFVRSCEIVK